MAAIDYTGVANAIEAILKADSRTNPARIFVEEEPQFAIMDSQQVIAVFLDSRQAPAGQQVLSQGKRTRMLLRMPIWVLAFSLEGYRRACELRNTVLGNLELVMMDNKTLSGTVATSWLEGGDMISARDSSGSTWVAGAESVLTAEVSAINT